MDIPIENQRVKEVINYFCNGNELLFSKEIGISQPRINRLFSLDSRNNKFPIVSYEIAQAIINKFVEVSSEWLLTGKGEMLKKDLSLQPVSNRLEGIPLIPLDAMAGFGVGESVILEVDCERFVVPAFKGADFLITVKGSSMYPKYSSGDIVACKKLPLDDLFFQWNKVYVLDTVQGALVKRIKKGGGDDSILIYSDNLEYESFELHRSQINAVALVIGVIRVE